MADQTHAVIEMVSAAPEMFLDKVWDYLALEHDTLVSITTLHDLILAAGLSYKLLHHQALEQDEMARTMWLRDAQRHFRASQLVWTDESSKDDWTIYLSTLWSVTFRRTRQLTCQVYLWGQV